MNYLPLTQILLASFWFCPALKNFYVSSITNGDNRTSIQRAQEKNSLTTYFGCPHSVPKLRVFESSKPYSYKGRISLNLKIKDALEKKMLIANQLGFSFLEAQTQYSILKQDDAMVSQRLSAPRGKKAGSVL